MRSHVLFLLFALLLMSTSFSQAQDENTLPNRVVAYYTSWSIYAREYFVTDIPADQITHINYAFANVSAEGEVILGDEWADVQYPYPDDPEGEPLLGNFRQLQLLKEAHPHLQTLISVGGWTWSARFSDVALTEESRERFARSAVEFMVRYGFDGVDIDWEYPSPTAGGHPLNRRRPEDPENFILMLAELRAQLDAQGEQDGRYYLLTIAAGAGPAAYEPLDWERIHPYLDFINVMTYDMAGGWSTVTGHQSPLYVPPAPDAISTDIAMQGHVRLGVPADKLVLGVPFYGRAWQGVSSENNGLNQPFEGLPAGTWEQGVMDYEDLVENYLTAGYTRFWDSTAQVPYLFNAETGIMVTYDDPESLAAKAAYVRDNGFGGIMFWELSADDDAALVTAISEGLNAP